MKSLLFQRDIPVPAACLEVCRQEIVINLRKEGRIYRMVLRDKVSPEDPMLIMVKALAFALQTGEAFNGTSPPRSVKDFLIKSNVVI